MNQTTRKRAPGHCCPLAPVRVIKAPRVQLATGLLRTREIPTSLPTARLQYPTAVTFHPEGSAKAGTELAMTRCTTRSNQNLLLHFVVNLPEAHGALGRFGRQLAVILLGELQRLFRYRLVERPVAKDRFDREPVQSG
jgi:hypothetical protein